MLRKISILLACAMGVGCSLDTLPSITNIQGDMLPPPRPGVAAMFRGLMVPVPGGRVNASGGNLFLSRRDMSVGTRVQEWVVGASWNSATGRWLWNFDLSLMDTRYGQPPIFTDATGYTAFLKSVAPGERIPGTRWFSHSATAVRSAGGLIYQFDGDGWLASVRWASREYPSIAFEREVVGGASKVTRIEQCLAEEQCAAIYTMSFDSQGRVSAITDHSGRSAFYLYDGSSERLASVRDPYDVQKGWLGTRYEYDERGRLEALVNSHAERVEYSYCDTTASVCRVVQRGEGDPVWSFAYTGMLADRQHASTAMTDPLGHASSFVFDFGLRTKSYTNPEGEIWSWSWNDTDLRKIISPNGVSTRFALAEDDSVQTITSPSGNSVVTTYAPFPAENRASPFERPILSVVDEVGVVETRSYAPTGELVAVANGEGDTTTHSLAANGDYTVVEPNGLTTSYTNRGDHGRYATFTKGGKTVTRAYDALGDLLSVDGLIDEDLSLDGLSVGQGGLVSRTYDADRNVATILLEDSSGSTQSTLAIDWRADHQIDLIQRPYGGDTDRVYDGHGRVAEVRTRVDGVWQSTLLEYDLGGRTTAALRPNGMATRWTYRGSGEIASIRHERDWTDPFESDGFAEFDYLDGQRVAVRDAAHGMAPEQTAYDADGRIQQITFPGGERLAYTYDVRDRVTSETFLRPNSTALRTFEYTYDLADRVTSLVEDGVEIRSSQYADGRVERTEYGNGVEVVHGYDPYTGAFGGFTATDSAEQVIAQMTVNRTTCGIQQPVSRCVMEHTQSFSGVASTSYAEYQLDDLGTERVIADSTGAVTPVDSFYQYDELSNLLSSPRGDFHYNSERNRLLEVEGAGSTVIDYVYDEAGFVTQRDGVSITWNGMGRVESVGEGLSVQWDALERLVSRTEAGATTQRRYGGLVEEDESSGEQRIDLGWVALDLSDDSHHYRLGDFRGNVKLTLDDSGTVSSHQRYASYDRIGVDGETPDSKGFASGHHAGDLVVLGARLYDPAVARFISEDPIPRVVNHYGYTLGNPVRFWDPTGEQAVATGYSQTEAHTTRIVTQGGEVSAIGPTFIYKIITVETPSITTVHYTYADASAAGPEASCQCSVETASQDYSTPSVALSGGFAEGSGLADEAGGNGSVGRGRDGPGNRGFFYRTETAESEGDLYCGLGFEILLMVPAIRCLRPLRNRMRRTI